MRSSPAWYEDWPVTASEGPASGEPPQDGWAQVRPPDGVAGPTLNFEFERHFTRPDFQPQQHVRVLIDTDGHPFCLFL